MEKLMEIPRNRNGLKIAAGKKKSPKSIAAQGFEAVEGLNEKDASKLSYRQHSFWQSYCTIGLRSPLFGSGGNRIWLFLYDANTLTG